MTSAHGGRLSGRVALVTGGASGIGRAIAVLFGREAASVGIVDMNETDGRAVCDDIRREGGRAMFLCADVTQTGECESAIQRIVSEWRRLDILVNNAGIIRRASVLETSEEEWDRAMAVNAKSVFLVSRLSIPIMARGGGGSIVNVASAWGLVGGRNAASYCASKAAVVNLTRAMALDHAAQNIRVNCVCPGDTDTPMLREEARQLGEPIDRFLAESAQRPLGRMGRPEEIAQAVLFLASEASSYVTGAALVVDGGGLAGSS